jgi:acetyl esterase/lipase
VFIDPEIAEFLEAFPIDFSVLGDDTLQGIRHTLSQTPEPELSDEVLRTDHVVVAADATPDVTVRVHQPKATGSARGCIYWMHAGGLTIGSYTMDDARFDRWCREFDMVGVSVEYRLAPETPYPGPLDDSYLGLGWVFDNAADLGVDPTRIGIGGASAGGGLAAAVALLSRDRAEYDIAYQLLVYPMLDDRQITASSQWDAPVWPPAANTYGWSAYLGDRKGAADLSPYAAAARAEDLSGLPPTLIAVGGADGFVDENLAYAQRLNEAGVATDCHVYAGAAHGFDSLAPSAQVSRRANQDINLWLSGR